MRRIVISQLFFACLVANAASANAPEDLLGASSRVNAMGGAGVASSRDGFSAYYNPGALTRCADSQITVDARRTFYALDVERTGADAPPNLSAPTEDFTRVGAAACIRLPRDFAIGVAVGSNLEKLTTMRLLAPTDEANFALYGAGLEYLSINAAVAWQPIEEISFGLGASVLLNSSLGVSAVMPVLQANPDGTFRDMSFNVNYRMSPRATPYLGVLVQPHERVRLGAAFRGALGHDLSMPVSITAVFLGFNLSLPIQIDGTTWYSPRSITVGGEVDVLRNLLLTAEFGWYDYGALANDSYPYLTIGAIPGTGGGALGLLGIPVAAPPDYRSVFTIRVGGELLLANDRLALRAGYGLRTSALPKPGYRNTTLLDGMMHSITVGGGYAFGRTWNDDDENADGDGDGIRYEGDEDTFERNFRIDAFARVSIMGEQSDAVKDIRYGGTMFDLGGSFTFGWR